MTLLKNIISAGRRACTAMAAAVLAVAATSCDSLIYNDEGDCTYRVRFEYDYNMKWADAFPAEVTSVTLYVIREDGTVALRKHDSSSALASKGYYMEITPEELAPGKYRLMAWAGDLEIGSFPEAEATNLQTLGRRLERNVEAGEHHHRGEMDRLYHGSLPSTLNTPLATNQDLTADGYCVFSESYGETFTIPMMKNTNQIRIHLQQAGGKPLDAEKFRFEILDHNAAMAHDNSMSEDTRVNYHPWKVRSVDSDLSIDGLPVSYGAAMAEFTVPRLMSAHSNDAILYVWAPEADDPSTEKLVIRIPLIQALLLAKGEYLADAGSRAQARPISDQEFLDRQDTYNLTFFLDEHSRWIQTQIFIESWMIVWNIVDDLS